MLNEIFSKQKNTAKNKDKMFAYTPAMEPIAQEARVAASNAALADACERLNVADEISLGEIDLWLAKHALSTVYANLKKYPALRGEMNYFGTLNGFIKHKDDLFFKVNPNCSFLLAGSIKQSSDAIVAQCRASFDADGLAVAFKIGAPPYTLSGIIVNAKCLHQRTILDNLEYGERLGHSPDGCKSVKSIIEHEIGHLLDYMLDISTDKEYLRFIRQFDAVQIGHGLSLYCTADKTQVLDNEVVAESYSEYRNNPRPRLIARTVGEILDKKYKRIYGEQN